MRGLFCGHEATGRGSACSRPTREWDPFWGAFAGAMERHGG